MNRVETKKVSTEKIRIDSFLPYGFVKRKVGRNNLYIKRELAGDPFYIEILSCDIKGLEDNRGSERLSGRGDVFRLDAADTGEDRGIVVREYRHGGLLRKILKDRFFIPHRALKELFVLTTGRFFGLNIPEPVGVSQSYGPLFLYKARIVTKEIPNGRNLPDFLEDKKITSDKRELVLKKSGEAIKQIHDAGIYHRDLNMNNIFVVNDGESIYVLDFDRAKISDKVGLNRRKKNLSRLLRSARKLERYGRLGFSFSEGDFELILRGYEGNDEKVFEALKKATISSRLLMIRAKIGWKLDRLLHGKENRD
jgi:tRNA A-37 threonylcarbamoyl transferase component Bud32